MYAGRVFMLIDNFVLPELKRLLTKRVYWYRLKEKRSIHIDFEEERTMEDLKLCDSEYRFMLIVWECAPVKSGELVRLCNERLGWKKSTTYTVIKKLETRGFLINQDTVVTPLVTKEECQAVESDYFVERTFGGSLPGFVAAFLGGKKITEQEAKELIDSHKEG